MTPPPVALISAGSRGLGATTARLFAKNGYRVVVNYASNAERAQKLVDELTAAHPHAPGAPAPAYFAIKADLSRRDDVGRLVDEAVGKMGRLDFVFSNGGWTMFRDMSDLNDNCFEEDWDTAWNMNVKSHLWLMQAAKKHLDETEGGFVTTSSLAGVSVSGSSLAYGVTKAAQIQLMKGLAVMAAPKIRVNSVSPGLLLTEWGDRFSDEAKEAHRQKTKLKRIVAVEDVAEQVLTLAKTKSMTGFNVVLDGGFTL